MEHKTILSGTWWDSWGCFLQGQQLDFDDPCGFYNSKIWNETVSKLGKWMEIALQSTLLPHACTQRFTNTWHIPIRYQPFPRQAWGKALSTACRKESIRKMHTVAQDQDFNPNGGNAHLDFFFFLPSAMKWWLPADRIPAILLPSLQTVGSGIWTWQASVFTLQPRWLIFLILNDILVQGSSSWR